MLSLGTSFPIVQQWVRQELGVIAANFLLRGHFHLAPPVNWKYFHLAPPDQKNKRKYFRLAPTDQKNKRKYFQITGSYVEVAQ